MLNREENSMDAQVNLEVSGEPMSVESDRPKGFWALTAIALWALAISIASLTGILGRIPPIAVGALIVGWFAAVSVACFRSAGLRSLLDRVGLRAITGLQLWRVAAASLFFWYGAHGLLPGEFVDRAAWGDAIAGVAGIIVCLWPTRGGYWLVHLFGLADLILATATGMRLRLAGPPEMANVATFPVALIPFFGVGLTAATHLVAFDWLRRGKR
jgi:hypothetical protein